MAYLLQNNKQHSSAAAHLAYTTETAPQSGPPETGTYEVSTKKPTVSHIIYSPSNLHIVFCLQSEQHSKVGEAAEQECRN